MSNSIFIIIGAYRNRFGRKVNAFIRKQIDGSGHLIVRSASLNGSKRVIIFVAIDDQNENEVFLNIRMSRIVKTIHTKRPCFVNFPAVYYVFINLVKFDVLIMFMNLPIFLWQNKKYYLCGVRLEFKQAIKM